jgi:hypothetical protein
MDTSYLNVKRYNIDPALLIKASQKVIRDLGGEIVKSSHAQILAELPNNRGSRSKGLNVTVYLNGAIYASGLCGTRKVSLSKSKAVVESFLGALDDHIKSIPKESIRSVKEAFAHACLHRNIQPMVDIPS